MGNHNFKQFIQILGGMFVALFIILELVRGHYGQLDAKLLWEDFGTCSSIVLIIGFCFDYSTVAELPINTPTPVSADYQKLFTDYIKKL